MVRAHHSAIARLCLFASLFLQLAAYACPTEIASVLGTGHVSVEMAGCGVDMDQPGLCVQHQVSDASATKTIADPMPSPIAAALVAMIVDVRSAPQARTTLAVKRVVSGAGPPVYLRFQALRL